jgi:hypothetical protein
VVAKHKFAPGQIVTVGVTAKIRAPAGRYEIVRLLPANDADLQYRVKAVEGGQEWVLREADLVHSER